MIHFIGIGGVSMSGIAQLLIARGKKISGSDRQNSPDVQKLINLGAEVSIGHSASNITGEIEKVIYTAAIAKDNAELLKARELGIETIERADYLGELMKDFACPIGISGTHGKTTTTGMISSILLAAEKNPTISIGGNLPQINGNFRVGGSEYLIFEACEYVDSFLKFNPKVAVITNIEADHLDYFSSISQIRDSFTKFAAKVPNDGFVVVNKDNKNAVVSADKADNPKVYYSVSDPSADVFAKDISFVNGLPKFKICWDDNQIEINLQVRGTHNISNSLAAFGVAIKERIDVDKIKLGLESFRGTERRFELRGEFDGIKVFDDYAHHPTEIETTFETAKSYPHNKTWYVFQPHTYSRTKMLWDDFLTTLSKPVNMVIADVYAARENPIKGITSEILANEVGAEYFDSFEKIAEYLKANAKSGDIIVTVGAGNVNKICDILLK